MSTQLAEDSDDVLRSWIACPPSAQRAWFEAHRQQIDLPFLEKLKAASDCKLRTSDAYLSDQMTQGMLLLASWLENEPLALPLACWARANWMIDYDPQQASTLYQCALATYRTTDKIQIIVRLLANLLGATLETDPTQAFAAYSEIVSWREELKPEDQIYLIGIEQNYGVLLRRSGRYQEAIDAHMRAMQLAAHFKQKKSIAAIHSNHALTLGSIGQFTACEAMLQHSIKLATEENLTLAVARDYMNLGELYTVLGRPADALRSLQVAHEKFSALNNQMELGSVLLREAALWERIGGLQRAQRNYADAVAQFTARAMWPQVGQALVQAAVVHRLEQNYGEAAALLQKGEALWQEQQHLLWLTRVRLEKIALTLAQNDYLRACNGFMDPLVKAIDPVRTPALSAQAQTLWAATCELLKSNTLEDAKRLLYHQDAQNAYHQVLAYSRSQGDYGLLRQALSGLGRLAWPQTPEAAFRWVEDAIQQDELIRTTLNVQELKATFLQGTDQLPLQLMRWAIELGEPSKALTYAWRAKGGALLDLLRVKNQSSEAMEQPILTTLAEVRNTLATLRWRTAVNTKLNESLQADEERQNPTVTALMERLSTLRRQQNTEGAHHTEWWQTAPSKLLERSEMDLLIEYACCEQRLYAFCVDRAGQCTAHTLTSVDIVVDLIEELTMALRPVLRQLSEGRQPSSNLYIEWQELLGQAYHLLIKPLTPLLSNGRLLIAPCAPLHQLPFAALWDGSHYLIENHAIEFIPTAALLSVPTPTAMLAEPLVIAASGAGLFPLTANEAQTIKKLFPKATALIDQTNALTHLTKLPTAPTFLHIAAHTLERADAPIFTALQLQEEMLSVEQSYDLPLYGTELVTLSSCRTNSGMDSAGTLLAFQSAFLLAGAQRVLSTSWDIHGAFSVPWMAEFYANLAKGLGVATAWRQTQLHCLEQKALSHPAVWAAFTCSRR